MNSNVQRMAKAPALLILASIIIVGAGMEAVSSILALVLILAAIMGLLFGALIGPLPNHFLSALSDHRERLSAHKAGCLERALIFYKR